MSERAPLPAQLRTLWLRWSALLIITLLALVVALSLLAARAARQLATPELEQTTQLIGRSLVQRTELALSEGIPIAGLVGVDDWFGDIVRSNRVVTSLALSDASGALLAAHDVPQAMRAALVAQHREQEGEIDGMYVRTLAVRNRDGVPVGWLHVGASAPDVLQHAGLWMLAAALLFGALGSAGLEQMLRRRLAAPLADCRAALSAVAAGELPLMRSTAYGDPAMRLRSALAERIHGVRKHNANLLLKIGEVRAAHFDPVIQQALDELAAPLAVRHMQNTAQTEIGARPPARSAVRRAVQAATLGLVVVALCLLGVQQLYRHADTQRLVSAADLSLQQAWQATLDQDQSALDGTLQALLAQPEFVALLTGSDDRALDAELDRRASAQLALAVFRLDGSARVASGQNDPLTRLDPLTFEPLQHGVTEIHGIWQNAARIYQSGVARRIKFGPDQEMVVMAAQPLEFSLRRLAARLGARTAVADLRGQPVSASDKALVAQWNLGQRRDRLDRGAGQVMVSFPLTAPSGHAIGTLLGTLPSPDPLGSGSVMLILLGAVIACAAAATLMIYLRGLFAPLARTAQTLEELSDGKTDIDLLAAQESREMWHAYHAVRRIAEKVDALETLRRARERQGRRQARFIRLQMMQLAEGLDEGARRGILEDLERIEHAGQPASAPDADDPRLERLADEFGILALGFQNLVSRVGQQYQELDRLVQELRDALRAKTQFIALQQELEIARNMQRSILPHEFKPLNGLELHAAMVPANEIGGDFYDFFTIDEHRVAMVVADVSGKGVPAAFFMAISRTLLRAIAQFSDSPAACVARMNDLLAADNEEMMFVTLFYAIFDTRDGSLTYANAGHNLPYVLRADGHIEAVPGTHGVALAVVSDFVYAQGQLTLQPGDGLFMFTDGITEASDGNDVLYGEARLVAALAELRGLPVREIPNRMVAVIKEYETGVAQADDITCLMARYRGPA